MRVSNILDPVHAELDPRVFDQPASLKPILKPLHSHWIKSQIYKTLEDAGYTNVEDWLTLVLTGSLTTFQYSDDSDVDVSLFVDVSKFPEWSRAEMIALMVERLDGRTLPGTPFPLQDFVVGEGIKPSDLYKPGLRSGYNIDNGKWIVPPERDRVHDVRAEQGGFYAWALQMADKMERLLQYEPEQAIEFWHMIHSKRRRDMVQGKGDFSESNIIYKMLANRNLFPQISQASGEYIAKTANVQYEPGQLHKGFWDKDDALHLWPTYKGDEDWEPSHTQYAVDHDSGAYTDPFVIHPNGTANVWNEFDGWHDPRHQEELQRAVPDLKVNDKWSFARVADAPKKPPHLRDMHEPTPDKKAELAKDFEVGKSHCGNCSMFWKNKSGSGHCWGYGEYDVEVEEVCDSWAPGKSFHTSNAPTTEGAHVIFHKFRPEQQHPPVHLGEKSLPWIYEPSTGVVHLGPPRSYHWELIERTPELRDQYSGAWEGPPTNQTPNIHGAMAWPSRKTEFMGDRPIEPEAKRAINEALGAPEEDEGVHWNFLRDN